MKVRRFPHPGWFQREPLLLAAGEAKSQGPKGQERGRRPLVGRQLTGKGRASATEERTRSAEDVPTRGGGEIQLEGEESISGFIGLVTTLIRCCIRKSLEPSGTEVQK